MDRQEKQRKQVAIITGASSGLGREFVRQVARAAQDGKAAQDSAQNGLDEIWVIARRRERLEALQQESGVPLRIVPLDLTEEESFAAYAALLAEHRPEVRLLVNCSGYGKFGGYDQIPMEETLGMIDLNCKAYVALSQLTAPYMPAGSHIVQLDSVAAFQPLPLFNVYAASKAFVLSYSRALNVELRPKGIHVLAVCPSWVRTNFFDRAERSSKTAVTNFHVMYEPAFVVRTALRDMRRGKDVSTPGGMVKAQRALTKLLPHRLVMRAWMKMQHK